MTAKRIQQPPMLCHIHQGPVCVLAMKFHQQGRELPQEGQAYRLVIDRGAAWPFCCLHPADNHFALNLDVLRRQQRQRGMASWQGEGCSHAALGLTSAHQARITARAQCETQGIKQDRLSRPGLTSQNRQAVFQPQIKLLDQYNIAN